MNNQKKMFVVTLIVLMSLFIVGSYIFKNVKNKNSEEVVALNQNLMIRDYSPAIGDPNSKVTLVEFLDPECEACAVFYPFVKDILKRNEGRVRLVIRYAPFHPNSKFIIRILEAARKQDKYWETIDLLFQKLPEWGNHHNPQPELVWTYLLSLNLDIDKIKVDMQDEKISKMIEQEIQDAEVFGVRKTPTFFVNGKPLDSFGLKQLEDAVESALK